MHKKETLEGVSEINKCRYIQIALVVLGCTLYEAPCTEVFIWKFSLQSKGYCILTYTNNPRGTLYKCSNCYMVSFKPLDAGSVLNHVA